MKASLISIAVACLLGFLIFGKISVGGGYSIAVWIPKGTQCTTDDVHQFGQKHDWAKELEQAAVPLPDDHLAALLNQLVTPSPQTQEHMLYYFAQYQVAVPIFGGTRGVNRAASFIERRLQVEAWCLSYATLPGVDARKRTAWAIFGSGFDARARRFLDAAIGSTATGPTETGLTATGPGDSAADSKREPDAATRQWLAKLQERLAK
ncbi:MAG: hypothetical protein AAF581_04580 [Planctomycetota bacterium]